MGVERVDYSSDEDYQQALQMESWQEQQWQEEQEAKRAEEQMIAEEMQKESAPLDGLVRRCEVSVKITDFDIATIEALHDLLLDKHGYKLNHTTLANARELTHKMYEAFKST